MSNKLDYDSQNEFKKLSAPIDVTDNTPLVSSVLDTQGYDAIELLLAAGVLADAGATFAVKIEESNDSGMSGANEVAAADLYGAPANWTEASDGAVQQFGYRGIKRYLQITITPSGNASSAPFFIGAFCRKKKVGSI